MEIIESITNKKIVEWCKLKTKKYRDITNMFIVEGKHLVIEAYKSGCLKYVLTLDDEEYENVITYKVNESILKKLSSLVTTPRIIGIVCKKDEEPIGNKVLVLDNIQDPGNLGTIIRSAVAFNIDTIVLSKNSVDLYNEKVIQSTQGNMFYINIVSKDLIGFLNIIKGEYKIISTDVNKGKDITNFKNDKKYAIIMGNEGNGVSEEIKNMADDFMYIKTSDNCESLNVAVASSIIMYELSK